LLAEGMKVVLADVEQSALDATVAELAASGDVTGIQCDVTNFDSVVELERAVIARHDKVHVLFNNAGVGAHEDVPLWELPLNDWRWTMAVNLWGVIHGIKAFMPGMLAHGEEGHVINTSSGNGGLILLPTTPIYSTSKAAVSCLTETLHLQLTMRQAKIRAHVLYPGPHIVSSNIFDARRNRPSEFAREIPQVAPPMSLEDVKTMFESMGRKFEATTPAEVAGHAIQGLRDDIYYILPWSTGGEAMFKARNEGVLTRTDPVPTF
ncbi:MAG: NAD(P)-dependent dehydrogenase (short-subunit alcohol dehydrogenase family), partial [Hyphomicrobiaceae bacterium]